MPVASGTQLGRYEIRSQIGEGGMGEVYLAEDRQLGRKVALKLLPSDLMRNEDRLRRFEREARAASALNHPNILTIFEIGKTEDAHFIATEFIDGETLRQHLSRATMNLSEALEVAIQVASALATAHEAGIVHRDIKPDNIMLRRDRLVKVLDFGLAKLTESQTVAADTSAPTVPKAQTEPGVVMGTVQYMSPEQARGLPVDARTDIFSLGCLLYEMLAHRTPFEGATRSDVMAAILSKEPQPLARYAPDVPAELERIVTKALAKDRNERYQTVKDLAIDLKRLKQRLEVEAEIRRTGHGTDSIDKDVKTKSVEREMSETLLMPAARPTSKASTFVNRIKDHKAIAIIILAAVVLAATALIYFRRGSVQSTKTIDSLAVLPFVNMSGNPDTEYLSDGITDSLINSLSQLPGLKVMSRNSVFRYKGQERDVREVGRELGVRAVLTGRVTERGDELWISVELVDAADNSHIWGEQYNRKLSDILILQSAISKDISEKLRQRLTGEDEKRVTKRYTDNTEAYHLYLQGRYYLYKRRPEAFKKAVEYFEQAIKKDPAYALAYAGLADSYNAFGNFSVTSGIESFPKAEEAAAKALELDDALAEAHDSMGRIKLYYHWNRAEAETEFKRAIELNPNYSGAHYGYAYCLITMKRADEAIAEIKRAEELDPFSLAIVSDAGEIYYFARRPEEAIAQLRKATQMDPNFVRAHFLLGRALEQKREFSEAIAEFNKAVSLSEDSTEVLAALGQGYAASGKRDEAQKVLDELQKRSKEIYISPHFMAIIYASLGENGRAFEWLDKAVEKRFPPLIYLEVNPIWDNLRTDPRYEEMLRRIGLK
ncbi:MAG: protein kinase [Acidobacteriota bacterium]|nr:protein kinase [Acidobacteriota bacterium]